MDDGREIFGWEYASARGVYVVHPLGGAGDVAFFILLEPAAARDFLCPTRAAHHRSQSRDPLFQADFFVGVQNVTLFLGHLKRDGEWTPRNEAHYV